MDPKTTVLISGTVSLDEIQGMMVIEHRGKPLLKLAEISQKIDQKLSEGACTVICVREFDHEDRAIYGHLLKKYNENFICYCGDPPRRM